MAFCSEGESEDEYDPKAYCGGYDVFLTYGRPLPPSEETCYLPFPSSSSDFGFDYGRPSYGFGVDRGGGDSESESVYGRMVPKFGSRYGGGKPHYGSGYGGGESEDASVYGRMEPKFGFGYGRRPQDESGYGGGESEYGSEYGRKPRYESGYGGGESEYGFGYGRKPHYESGYGGGESEYGSGYGRKPHYESGYGGGESEYGSGYGRKPHYESGYGGGDVGRLAMEEEEHSNGEGGSEGSAYGRKKSEEYESGYKKLDYAEKNLYQKPSYGTSSGIGSSQVEQYNLHEQAGQLFSHGVNDFMSLTQDGSRGIQPSASIEDNQPRLTQDRSRGLEPTIPNKDTQPQQFNQDGLREYEPPTLYKANQVTMQQIYAEPSRDEHTKSSSEMSSFSVYSDSDIMVATNSLHESSKIGKGGYGTVYIGKLHGTLVAVKMLDPDNNEGQKVFFLELVALCRMRHRNLVNLLGACFENNALVYEFLQNGSLEDCLSKRSSFLTWKIRTRIIFDICSALKFLHSKSIIHGDLKPDNILLDENFNAKLADFGLCRFIPKGNTSGAFIATNPKGTFAYIDLKFLETGILRPSSDLYSFGVTILKIVTGMPPLGLSRRVRDSDDNLFAQMIDPAAGSWSFEIAKELAYWGLQCCYHNEKSSQLMNDMWISLEMMLEEIELPIPISSGS